MEDSPLQPANTNGKDYWIGMVSSLHYLLRIYCVLSKAYMVIYVNNWLAYDIVVSVELDIGIRPRRLLFLFSF